MTTPTMPPPTGPTLRAVSLIKFAIREVTAFVAHSFAEEDKQVVERISQFLAKLGLVCDSGLRSEPKSVSDKVLSRLYAAELFVGIFTRKHKKDDGSYTTSPWLIEEKAAAINAGKRLLLFVEEGVENDIGGLQGDYEHIRFNRNDLADGLIRAMDYVLAITTVPLQCQVDYTKNHINFKLQAAKVDIEGQIKSLEKQHEISPNNSAVLLELADAYEKAGKRDSAIHILRVFIRNNPKISEAYHQLAHLLENAGELDEALTNYQHSLDLKPNDYKSHRCYGRCLYRKAKQLIDSTARKSTLDKAIRLLQRAAIIGGERHHQEIQADIFLVQEAQSDAGTHSKSLKTKMLTKPLKAKPPTKRKRK